MDNRVAIITGGDSGLGRVFAKKLSLEGVAIALISRIESRDYIENDREMSILTSPILRFYYEDFAREASKIVSDVYEALGVPTCLINNAGRRLKKSPFDVSIEDFESIVNVNCASSYFLSVEFAKLLRKKDKNGNVVNIASHLGFVGARDHSLYCMAKSGVIGMTRALALDFARFGISVNAVAPGPTNTVKAGLINDELEAMDFLQRMPIARRIEPAEVADAVSFLARSSGAITGQTIIVDGGWTSW